MYACMFKQFYMKTGACKFGPTCKFHHPKDIQIPSATQENVSSKLNEYLFKTSDTAGDTNAYSPLVSFAPAMLHNTKGLPLRPVTI